MENNMGPNAPGKQLLKVTGILMVIFSSIVLVLAFLSAAAIGALLGAFGGAVAATAGFLAMLLAFLPGIFEFVAGILGIVNANKPEKAGICLAFGIIVLVLVVISTIYSKIDWTSAVGFVLPVLYLIGAIKNKQAARK